MTIEQRMRIRLEEMAKERDAAIEDAKDWERLAYRYQGEREALADQLSRHSMDAGHAEQRRAESRAIRKALGFEEDADNVSPRDLLDALARLKAEWQAEALEDASSRLVQDWDESVAARRVQSIADELRRQTEGKP